MSVLIKGMEMPTSCNCCRFAVDGWCYAYGKPNIDALTNDGRTNFCPLVPVPPHGRLIESVELYGRAEDIKTKALSVCDKSQSWQFGVFWAIEQIKAALTNTPTIIPGEEGET